MLSKATALKLLTGLAGAVLVAASILGLRATGLLEAVDLVAYDRLFIRQLGPAERVSATVTVVTVTDDDYERYGYPIPDVTLAALLQRLVDAGAVGVGVDLYRDHAYPPGTEDFEALIRSEPRIVFIMRLGTTVARAPPPPALVGTAQVGFSDFPLDDDGKVRRSLLAVNDGGQMHFSLAWRVANLYLAARGVRPAPDPLGRVGLGAAVLSRLLPDDGPYVAADTAGFQIPLDFAGAAEFPQVTMTQVLEAGGRFADAFKGRMVFVGSSAATVNDPAHTPHRSPETGVMVHAHSADQLVGAALRGGRTVHFLPGASEAALVLAWAFLGFVLALVGSSLQGLGLGVATAVAATGALGYLSLLHRVWLPLIPMALALVGSAAVVLGYLYTLERKGMGLRLRIWQRSPRANGAGDPSQLVFVSAKSEDYPVAHVVNDYLRAQGVATFFSDVALREAGDSDFRRGIDRQLERASHMVVVGSRIEHIESRWVQAEWGTFVNEMRSGRARGNLVTIVVGGVQPAELPIALRQYEVFPYDEDRLADLLPYFTAAAR